MESTYHLCANFKGAKLYIWDTSHYSLNVANKLKNGHMAMEWTNDVQDKQILLKFMMVNTYIKYDHSLFYVAIIPVIIAAINILYAPSVSDFFPRR